VVFISATFVFAMLNILLLLKKHPSSMGKFVQKLMKGVSKMATSYVEYPATPVQRTFSWSGIFAGTFLFLAIEATFAILGVAVFASAANPMSTNPVGTGITTGAGIWMVILSIVALYFAGKLAARLSGASTRNLGMHTGFVTFGMSVFTSILITALMLGSTVAGSTGIRYDTPTHVANVLMTGGYWLFVALVLGMISAAVGGMHGSVSGQKTTSTARMIPEEKRAA
jgi:hypothetical protein